MNTQYISNYFDQYIENGYDTPLRELHSCYVTELNDNIKLLASRHKQLCIDFIINNKNNQLYIDVYCSKCIGYFEIAKEKIYEDMWNKIKKFDDKQKKVFIKNG